MMHGREKSGLAIVAAKPSNEAGLPAEEVVERGRGPRGMRTISTRSGHRAGPAWNRGWPHTTSSAQALARAALGRHSPEVGAVCGKAARTVLCGGRAVMPVPTATTGRLA